MVSIIPYSDCYWVGGLTLFGKKLPMASEEMSNYFHIGVRKPVTNF